MTNDSTKKVRNIFQRERLQFKTVGPSKTQQSAKEETDVNAILKRYSKTGVITHVNEVKAAYGDFSDVGTYQEAIDKVQNAMSEFMDLPANIRKEFHNDPANMVEFLEDPKNAKKAVELGLAKVTETFPPKVKDSGKQEAAQKDVPKPSEAPA